MCAAEQLKLTWSDPGWWTSLLHITTKRITPGLMLPLLHRNMVWRSNTSSPSLSIVRISTACNTIPTLLGEWQSISSSTSSYLFLPGHLFIGTKHNTNHESSLHLPSALPYDKNSECLINLLVCDCRAPGEFEDTKIQYQAFREKENSLILLTHPARHEPRPKEAQHSTRVST